MSRKVDLHRSYRSRLALPAEVRFELPASGADAGQCRQAIKLAAGAPTAAGSSDSARRRDTRKTVLVLLCRVP